MKYFILVPDGAGDDPVEALGGKTPLEVAKLDNINKLAAKGTVGMVKTIPDGIAPGSDAANLSVMGYDPSVYLTGRSPLEAASIGIDMADTDVAYRTNIITLKNPDESLTGKDRFDGDFDDMIIEDHSAGDITTEEADELIKEANKAFANDSVRFYTGVSYRHCMIVKNGTTDQDLTPPHDHLGEPAGGYLPKGEGAAFIEDIMRRSFEIFKEHPVNLKRIEKGLNPANTLWIWGQGTKPALTDFKSRYGISGAAISAVDLIKGIAICAGLDSIDVEGATGTLHTNFEGKKDAAIEAFKEGKDFVYMHLEGPDECSHQGDLGGKIKCLEDIDVKILAPVVEYLEEAGGPYSVLVVPDHRTPLRIRTHSADPVPFVLYRSNREISEDRNKRFCEVSGAKGISLDSGYELADMFFAGK